MYSRNDLIEKFNLGSQIVLDLGCGETKKIGLIGVDKRPCAGVDIVWDFEKGLPFEDNCIDGVYLSHIVEHIKDFISFMEKIYRIARNDALINIIAPYYTSRGAVRDPTHVRYITEDTFQYFQHPTPYGIKTKFLIEKITYDMKVPFRYFPEYLKKRFRRYLWNVVDNFYITLRVVK